MTTTDPTLQPLIKEDERRQFFFWLGVFVLPLFWSWFTLSRKHTRRERVAAFLWLAVFGIWLLPAGIAVVAHLVLEPLGLGRTERKEERPSTIDSP